MSILRREDYLPDPALPLEIRRAVVERPTSADHGHEFTEMVLVTAGAGEHVHDGCAYPISRGDLFVIASGRAHAYSAPRDLEVQLFLFDEPWFLARFPDLSRLSGYQGFFHLEPAARATHARMGKVPLTPDAMHELQRETGVIAAEKAEQRAGYALRAAACFAGLLVQVCRAFTELRTPLTRELRRVGDAIVVLEEHFAEPWTVGQLARQVGVSESTLLRYFKRSTGRTPMAWLTDLRLSKARSLLRTTDRRIAAVAVGSGFPDANHFARVFKAHHGLTPTAFRASGTD